MEGTLPLPTGPATPAEALDPTRRTPGYCGCGCGAPVARRYKPGHDAKHHSTLAAALTSGNWRQATRAADLLADLGWTGYADRAALRNTPYRDQRGQALPHLTEVQVWQVDTDGTYHSRRTCPALTAHAKRHGQTRLGGTCRDRYLAFVTNTPEIAATLATSWDSCTSCTTAHHRDEAAERAEMQAAQVVAAHTDPKPTRLTAKQAKQGGWTVAPDTPGQRPLVVTLDPTDPRNPAKATRARQGEPLAPAPWAAPAA